MKEQDKQLLLKDLCARLPYGVIIRNGYVEFKLHKISDERINDLEKIEDCKPYLRPMSSMTEEELKEFRACHCVYDLHPDFQPMMCNIANELNMFNWLNEHHFDYRGLIEKSLAIVAPNNMYK